MKMKFASAVLSKKSAKFALSTVMVAGALLASGVASATVISLGTVPLSPTDPLAFTETHAKGFFSDTVNFSIAAGSLDSSLNNLKLTLGTINPVTVYDISNLSYTLYTAAGTKIGGVYGADDVTYTNLFSGGGDYYFTVTGNAVGSAGGTYGMSLLAAVPEPETYGMMLGGLGLIGLIARRRKASTTV